MTAEPSLAAPGVAGAAAPAADGKRPWKLMLPGIVIAAAALGLMVYVTYQAWFVEAIASGTGLLILAALFPAYVGGVFLYSYGYHRRNWREALKLTGIVVGITAALLLILGVVLVLIAASSKRKGSSDSPRVWRKKSGSNKGAVAAAVASSLQSESDIARVQEVRRNLDPSARLDDDEAGTPGTVKGVITCASCGRRFLPLKTTTACPQCHTPLPPK